MRSDAYVPAAFHRDEMARLKTRIKQLEISHDDWRTKARRATSENERLRATLEAYFDEDGEYATNLPAWERAARDALEGKPCDGD